MGRCTDYPKGWLEVEGRSYYLCDVHVDTCAVCRTFQPDADIAYEGNVCDSCKRTHPGAYFELAEYDPDW